MLVRRSLACKSLGRNCQRENSIYTTFAQDLNNIFYTISGSDTCFILTVDFFIAKIKQGFVVRLAQRCKKEKVAVFGRMNFYGMEGAFAWSCHIDDILSWIFFLMKVIIVSNSAIILQVKSIPRVQTKYFESHYTTSGEWIQYFPQRNQI